MNEAQKTKNQLVTDKLKTTIGTQAIYIAELEAELSIVLQKIKDAQVDVKPTEE